MSYNECPEEYEGHEQPPPADCPNERFVMCNLVGVDKGALTMVKNVLERSGKDEVKDALIDSVVIEGWIKQVQKRMDGVAAERDKIDSVLEDLTMIKDSCDRAYESLNDARDALSELV